MAPKNGDSCAPASSTWDEGGYRFRVWQMNRQHEDITIELGCTSDAEAYVLALQFLRLVGFVIFRAQLQNWKGEHMMYYKPKNGWTFGDDRDLTVH